MAAAVALALVAGQSNAADRPMSYLKSFGPINGQVLPLTWWLIWLSVAVVLFIAIATVAGIWVRRSSEREAAREAITEDSGGIRWITIGVGVSTIALVISMVWTAYTMAAINKPSAEPKITIEVTGHQWWWQVRYSDGNVAREFETANDIHLPVGEPVAVKLRAADVIHSFWIPGLAGKTDLIPNQVNTTWIEASVPGRYRGQCGEYCGQQHAHMALVAVAEEAQKFKEWWDRQLEPAPQPDPQAEAGRAAFVQKCGACHAVRGSLAQGRLGPDLSHVVSRVGLAANTLPNNPAYLSGWIADPQAVKPGAKMPNLDISGRDLANVRTYLETLK